MAGRGTLTTGFAVMAAVGVLAVLGLVVDAVGTGGGAAVPVAAWVVAIAGLSVAALRRPEPTTWVLTALTVVVVALWAWFAADVEWWIRYMDVRGPVLPMVAMAGSVPAAFLGLQRTFPAAIQLLVLGLAPATPLAVFAASSDLPERARPILYGAVLLAGAPGAIVAGALYVVSVLQRRADPWSGYSR